MKNSPPIFKLVPSPLLNMAGNKFLFFAKMFKFFVLRLKTDLLQADIDIPPEKYINMAVFASAFYFIILSAISAVALFFSKSMFLLPIALLLTVSVSMSLFLYSIYYPRFSSLKRVKKLETSLLTAMRHVLIKVRSGVPFFQALVSLSEGYGELSKEIKLLVERVNGGVPIETALEDAAAKNPSLYFRRALLQISTAIKSGADINGTLTSIIETFSQTIIINAKRYGRVLGFWSVLYLIISIIFPAMGISFLVMVSSFLGTGLGIYVFAFIAVGFLLMQIIFMSMINNTKPSMVVY